MISHSNFFISSFLLRGIFPQTINFKIRIAFLLLRIILLHFTLNIFLINFTNIPLFNKRLQIFIPFHEISNGFFIKPGISLHLIDFHFKQLNLFILLCHFIKQFKRLLSENDKLFFKCLYFLSLIYG